MKKADITPGLVVAFARSTSAYERPYKGRVLGWVEETTGLVPRRYGAGTVMGRIEPHWSVEALEDCDIGYKSHKRGAMLRLQSRNILRTWEDHEQAEALRAEDKALQVQRLKARWAAHDQIMVDIQEGLRRAGVEVPNPCGVNWVSRLIGSEWDRETRSPQTTVEVPLSVLHQILQGVRAVDEREGL